MIISRMGARNQARRGAVAPLVALMMIPIMGAVALALDGGMILDYKRAVQAAADEAALAGAVELYTHYPTKYGIDSDGLAKQSALTTAAANGFNTTNSTIYVKTAGNAAKQGRFSANSGLLKAGYIEVTIEYHQERGFSSIWGGNHITIVGHAVARGAWIPVKNGVIALNPTGDATLKANGGGLIQVNNGDVLVNSNGTSAGTTSGGNAIVSTVGTYITGGYSGIGFTPTPHTGHPPTPDPLAHLPEPAIPGTNGTETRNNSTNPPTITLTPGYYPNGFKSTQAIVNLSPGIYYFGRGFEISGQAGLNSDRAMIFNAGTGSSQGITITGQGAVTITPPTDGLYKGISIFQARSSDAPIKITGNGNFNVHGTVYGAGANANIEGNGDVSVAGQVIVGTLNVGGNGTTVIDFQAPDAPNTRIMQLVE